MWNRWPGHSKPVHWDNSEGWDGEGGGKGVWDKRADVHPWLIHVNVWQKPPQNCKVISLQLKKKNLWRNIFFPFIKQTKKRSNVKKNLKIKEIQFAPDLFRQPPLLLYGLDYFLIYISVNIEATHIKRKNSIWYSNVYYFVVGSVFVFSIEIMIQWENNIHDFEYV